MTASRARIGFVCGNTYGFRALSSAVVQQLSRLGSVELFLLNYPEQPPIQPLVDELARASHVSGAHLIPDNRCAWRHHAVLGALSRSVRRAPLDVLLVDTDFMPMSRYLIAAARARRVPVLGVQKEIPKRLLMACGGGAAQHGSKTAPGAMARANKLARGLILGPGRREWLRRLGQEARARARRLWLYGIHHALLPLWNAGRVFPMRSVERRTQFVSDRVDAAIVYQEQVRDALRRFFPSLDVRLARHPLAAACRCEGAAPPKMLVVLTGPWRNCLGPECPAEQLEAQWCRTIASAVAVRQFDEVHIRPHPREEGRHPQRLADRLAASGIAARVLEPTAPPLRETVCQYAGVLGPPSGALAEAAAACQRAFVIGVLGHQGARSDAPLEAFAPEIAVLEAGGELRAEHFIRRRVDASGHPTIAELVAEWLP